MYDNIRIFTANGQAVQVTRGNGKHNILSLDEAKNYLRKWWKQSEKRHQTRQVAIYITKDGATSCNVFRQLADVMTYLRDNLWPMETADSVSFHFSYPRSEM